MSPRRGSEERSSGRDLSSLGRRDSRWLLDFAEDVNSQTGEDGVLRKVLDVLPDRDGWCVEFGAWDGLHLTNTRDLIQNFGYSGVLIEADARRFVELRRNYEDREDVLTLHKSVGFGPDDNLDLILGRTSVPSGFDLLVVDIDGNDYHVWAATQFYSPKVVMIEFNPTIPTEVSFVQPADPSISQGASLAALVELGRTKGYELVVVLPFNALFVLSAYYPLFEIVDNDPRVLRADTSDVTYLFSGFDGTVFLHGKRKLPWHDLALKESRWQQLPRFLRKYPENYSQAERVLFAFYLLVRRPREFFRRLRARLSRRG